MNTLRGAIHEYLVMRRDLGFKLVQTERWLRNFATFMEGQGASCITIELALQWAVQPQSSHPSYGAKRLIALRCFARHRRATDPSTEVPAQGLLPYRPLRAKPYLYTEEEIQRLMAAAKTLPPRNGLRGWTYYCLLGLLAVTGLRISEALALKRDDVDLSGGLLTIREAKFAKSRLVPLHPSTQEVLRKYAQQRDAYPGCSRSAHFLVSETGASLDASTIRQTFCELSRQIGLRGPKDHIGLDYITFATASRSKCFCAGIDPVRMSNSVYRLSPLSWDMRVCAIPIGIYLLVPNSWDRQHGGWSNDGGSHHDSDSKSCPAP